MAGPVIGDPIPDWLKPENASVFDGPMTKAIRAIASAIGANDPQSQIVGMMAPMQAGAVESPVGKALQAVANKIRAFHGSPHDFDRFATSKIGTGEGAQAYGHGLYFAENEGTAKVYRDALGGDAIHMPDGAQKVFERGTPEWIAQNNLNTFAGQQDVNPYQMARSWIRKEIQNGVGKNTGRYDQNVKALEILNEWEAKGAKPGPAGRMYEVNINADPEHFLDWDAPLSQQPQAVRDALAKKVQALKDRGEPLMHSYIKKMEDGSLPGEAVYSGLGNGTKESASAELHRAGVPGIKYLDQGSRGGRAAYRGDAAYLHAAESFKSAGQSADEAMAGMQRAYKGAAPDELRSAVHEAYDITPQTRNFVVFDDSLVSILKKYGVALGTIEGLRRKASANGGKLDQADVQAVMQ